MGYKELYSRLRGSLRFEMDSLDRHYEELAPNQMEAAEMAAEIAQDRDNAKADLDLVAAQVAKESRNELTDGKKKSEKQIDNETPLNTQYQKALQKLIDLEAEVAKWRSLVDAFRTKTSAMKHLSEMIVAGYIAPSSKSYRVPPKAPEANRRSRPPKEDD